MAMPNLCIIQVLTTSLSDFVILDFLKPPVQVFLLGSFVFGVGSLKRMVDRSIVQRALFMTICGYRDLPWNEQEALYSSEDVR